MPDSLLATHQLTRSFGAHRAVDALSLQVNAGEIVGFIGGNGAGKTTTMRMIMGVLSPSGGDITWRGAPATEQVRRRFGYMPEERGLYPKQPVLSQLIYFGRLQGLDGRQARTAAGQLLERFGLTCRAGDKVESLSLGNQQRVQIAAAVIAKPELLILDEPFSGLDPAAIDSMTSLLREHAARGVGVLFSSHQLELVQSVCDRLIVLARGRIVADGTPAELQRRGRTRYKLSVGAPLDWLDSSSRVQVCALEGHSAILTLSDARDADALLREALRHGPVYELSEVVPSLAEIYREVAA
ncbi:MAG TPA: ATP-binding cassette domain-containing protein [Jatrophihabitans sp.]|nr:ATP-binding cassette domain-containing protein [Jatrophihabitans sp.]